MNIAFVTSGLEEQKNGVADHLFLLAKEVVACGHNVMLLSMNDPFAPELVRFTASSRLSVCRIPALVKRENRFQVANDILHSFKPDWVSFHFVPYGFNPKGIVCCEVKRFQKLFANYNLHIMLHELWIGEGLSANFSHKLIGKIQKYFILKMLKSLKAEVVHTSTELYRTMLASNCVDSKLLPMFGNVPLEKNIEIEWIFLEHQKRDIEIIIPNLKQYVFVAIFGLHRASAMQFKQVIKKIIECGENANKKVVFWAIGKMGHDFSMFRDEVAKTKAKLVEFGVISTSKISELLQLADFGLSFMPIELAKKSGTIAAMLEHGLFVVCCATDKIVEELPLDVLNERRLLTLNSELSTLFITKTEHEKSVDAPKRVAELFLQSLLEVNNC